MHPDIKPWTKAVHVVLLVPVYSSLVAVVSITCLQQEMLYHLVPLQSPHCTSANALSLLVFHQSFSTIPGKTTKAKGTGPKSGQPMDIVEALKSRRPLRKTSTALALEGTYKFLHFCTSSCISVQVPAFLK